MAERTIPYITYSEWGLANRFGLEIVLNENLKKHSYLHNLLLDHELKHNEKVLFNIKHDYSSLVFEKFTDWIVKCVFMCRYPKSLVQLSPIYFHNGRPYLDLSLIILYGISAGILILNWRLG